MLKVKPGTLILLSGPPGSGKSSTFDDQDYDNVVISSDQIRTTLFGSKSTLVDGSYSEQPNDLDDRLVFQTLEAAVASRLHQGMLTIVDATLIDDKRREPFGKLAAKYNRPLFVIIFDIDWETLVKRNKERDKPVPHIVLESFYARFQRDSKYPYIVWKEADIDPEDPLPIQYDYLILPKELDVIGDIHGCIEPLHQLLDQWGYVDLIHPDSRTLLFLGDLIDRGPDSLGVLDLAMEAVTKGHHVLLGNHEANLLRGLQGEEIRSKNTSVTLGLVKQRGKEYEQSIINFLSGLPYFALSHDKAVGYCHADVDLFDEDNLRSFVYGKSKIGRPNDTDAEFAAFYKLNRQGVYHLVRGHIPATSPQECLTVLDGGIGWGGPLLGLRSNSKSSIPDQGTIHSIPYDFDCRQQPETYLSKIEPLLKQKYLSESKHDSLRLYTYTKKAFFEVPSFWEQNPLLRQTRSLVIGLDDNPVNCPFTRLKNYGEPGTSIAKEKLVIATEKINGFLGQCFVHPYEDKLVFTTSGSLDPDNEHLKMYKSLFFGKSLYKPVREWLRGQPATATLMFEVIHPDDPHIIPYDQAALYLIGIGRPEGYGMPDEIQELARSLGINYPASSGVITFKEALEVNARTTIEGFMIRDIDSTYLVKLKSPRYLVQKLLARLNSGKVSFMYANPEEFCRQHLSGQEELKRLVEAIVNELPGQEWLEMSEQGRLVFTRKVLQNV